MLDFVSDVVDPGVVITTGGPSVGVGIAGGDGVDGINNDIVIVQQKGSSLRLLRRCGGKNCVEGMSLPQLYVSRSVRRVRVIPEPCPRPTYA